MHFITLIGWVTTKKLAKPSDWIFTQSWLSKQNASLHSSFGFTVSTFTGWILGICPGIRVSSGHLIHGSSTLKSPRIKRWTSQNPYHHHPPSPYKKQQQNQKPTNMAPNHDDFKFISLFQPDFLPKWHAGVDGLSTWTTTQWLPVVSTETAPRIS